MKAKARDKQDETCEVELLALPIREQGQCVPALGGAVSEHREGSQLK